jgi:hypothetical protein
MVARPCLTSSRLAISAEAGPNHTYARRRPYWSRVSASVSSRTAAPPTSFSRACRACPEKSSPISGVSIPMRRTSSRTPSRITTMVSPSITSSTRAAPGNAVLVAPAVVMLVVARGTDVATEDVPVVAVSGGAVDVVGLAVEAATTASVEPAVGTPAEGPSATVNAASTSCAMPCL